MEIIYYHKPFSKHCSKPVDHFLFLLAVTGRVWSPFPYYNREFDMETCFCVNCGLRLDIGIFPLCC